jgi:ribosomal protein S26
VEVRKKERRKKKKKGLASGIQCINTNFKYSNEKIKIERIRELQPTNES